MANKSPYQQPLNDLYAVYHSSREGLSTAQANQNREQFGKNQLAQKKKKPVWMIFLEQFKDFLVIILIIAAIISAITGELESTIVILVVITMNAILGTVQTVKAEKSLDNLKSLSAPHAKVLRDDTTELPAESHSILFLRWYFHLSVHFHWSATMQPLKYEHLPELGRQPPAK